MSGLHSADRWSGLETMEMREIGSTLLFPTDSDFQFELKEFEGEEERFKNDVSGSDRKGFLMVFRAHSTDSKTLRSPCVVAGKCKLTKACLKEFTEINLPAKEQRKIGRTTYTQLNWPGVQGFLTCPKCAQKAKVGGDYSLIFYTMAQLQATAVPFAIGTRIAARLMCIQCMNQISRGKTPKNTEICGAGAGDPVRMYFESTSIYIFFRDAVRLPMNEPAKASKLYGNFVKQFQSSLESFFSPEICKAGSAFFQETRGLAPTLMFPDEDMLKKRARDLRKANLCFVCQKEGSILRCSRCSKVTYCGRDCQRKDWKRHKICECVPPDDPTVNRK
jgi:hypothetical protein